MFCDVEFPDDLTRFRYLGAFSDCVTLLETPAKPTHKMVLLFVHRFSIYYKSFQHVKILLKALSNSTPALVVSAIALVCILSNSPSKHTTSFRCPYNVHNIKTTSYGCQNNVVCVLGLFKQNPTRYF